MASKRYSDTFPEEVCKFIEANYLGTGYKKMVEMLKEQFGREYTPQQIKSFYSNRKLNSGLTGQFEKGSHPPQQRAEDES